MNRHNQAVYRLNSLLVVALLVSGLLFYSGNAMAQVWTLSNGGSTATVNVGNTGTLGMNSWTVGGVPGSQLNQQWFWYSVNSAPLQPINAIGTATVYNFSVPSTPVDNIGVQYQNSQLLVQVGYNLQGNGANSGSADMTENLAIQNMSASAITLSFFQYSFFDLLQPNPNTISVSGSAGAYSGAVQTTTGASGNGIAEVIDAPLANRAEVGFAPSTYNNLNSGSYYDLNDSTGPLSGQVTWAFEWIATLQPYGSVDQYGNPTDTLDITKDKGLSITLAPEPSTIALIALGMGALGLALRRKLS